MLQAGRVGRQQLCWGPSTCHFGRIFSLRLFCFSWETSFIVFCFGTLFLVFAGCSVFLEGWFVAPVYFEQRLWVAFNCSVHSISEDTPFQTHVSLLASFHLAFLRAKFNWVLLNMADPCYPVQACSAHCTIGQKIQEIRC